MSARQVTRAGRATFWERLRWLLTGNEPPPPSAIADPLLERLAVIERRLADLASPPPPPAPDPSEPAATREALAALEKQIGRLGREQFKANTLGEAQAERLAAALETLTAAEAQHEARLTALRDQARADQAATRLEVVQALLPTLDGLDEAIRAGRELLALPPAPPPRSSGWLEWLTGPPPAPATDAAPRAAMAAWLDGLDFIRQRLLATLAAEGVQPMQALEQPFDPHQHLALEVVPATTTLPAGTVAAEFRRGYRLGARVLRPAEVAVAKD